MSNVEAIGITPAKTTVDFEPGKEGIVNFKIINDEHKKMKVLIVPDNEIQLEIYYNGILLNEAVTFDENESEKNFQYKFKLPQEMQPGLHEIKIMAFEIQEQENQKISITATVAVATQLAVRKFYPNKYLELDLNIVESDVGGTTKFIVSALNLGEQNIEKAYAKIEIFDSVKKIDALQTTSNNIQTKERKDFIIEWKPEAKGKYNAKATVYFDGNEIEIKKDFNIGSIKLEIINLTIKEFKLGEIVELELFVKNNWNEQLKNVYAELLISQNSLKSNFKNIQPFSTSSLIIHWNTQNIKPGDYEAKLMLYYLDKKLEKELRLHIEKNSIKIEAPDFTFKKVVNNKKETILIISIIIFVIIVLISFFFKKRKNQHFVFKQKTITKY